MPEFEKGKKKTGGRPKGVDVPHTRKQVSDICEEMGYDPVKALIELATNKVASFDVRASCAKELTQYIYPKRKALEISGELDVAMMERAKEFAAMSDEELRALAEKELAKRSK